MKNSSRDRRNSAALVLIIIPLLMAFFWIDSGRAQDPQPLTISGVSREEALQLGEKMYREGILPSGEPMQAVVKGDIPVSGTAFTCSSCHLRSGLGSIEGRVITSPTNGSKLFLPLSVFYKGVEVTTMPPRRPAYTDESLAEVLRGGVDPSGRILDDIMPRYLLDDKDMALLISYLKSLSSQFSPGASDEALRFATIITEDVSPADCDALVGPLEDYFRFKNNTAKMYGTQPRQARMAEAMTGSRASGSLRLSLSLWVLKGPPETWRGQIEEYYRKGPVFALLGGIAKGEWKPIHKFCEDNHIPCLFPITDFPVISETDWYTLYFSKGYYQEGEGAARYLNGMDASLRGRAIVQIVSASREGLALSAGFRETWRDVGNGAPVEVMLKAGETLTWEFLQGVLAREKPAAVILWVDSGVLPALESLAADRNRPEVVFVSSSYLGKSIWTLKEQVRDFTYITYPFRLPQDEAKYLRDIEPLVKGARGAGDAQITLKRTYSLIQVLTQALMDMRGNYHRDNFFDVISMMADQQVPLYERLSFGPGQRYASKGCYIVQLTKGASSELIKKSDWVIQ